MGAIQRTLIFVKCTAQVKTNISRCNVPLGPIIGGILGGVAVLMLINVVAIVWYIRREKKRNRSRIQSGVSGFVGTWTAPLSPETQVRIR